MAPTPCEPLRGGPTMHPGASGVASEQRARALRDANRVRCGRARLKRSLASGGRSAADLISDPPVEVRTMTVRQLVVSQRGWGPVRSRRLLRAASVPEGKELRSLTERQRRVLAARLEFHDAHRGRVQELGWS